MKMSAVARNIDFVGVSEEALASGFAWVAVRVRIICCYASAIPQPICEALAELFSCRPHRAPIVYSTLRYFPPPKSRIKHPRACGSSARRSLADASVSHCRTVVRPLQRMRLERDADDNRTALITPSNARFTDLGMLVSRVTFIQQRSYDRRCRTSHSCQMRTHAAQHPIACIRCSGPTSLPSPRAASGKDRLSSNGYAIRHSRLDGPARPHLRRDRKRT
jgi:hypothetical protein